jgi:hypothetical protein
VTGFASKNGGEIDVGDVVILPGGSVAVHVESRSRAAVNGACAVIGADGSTVDKFLIIDGHGESATVPAGDYDLLVSARGFELNHEPVRIEIGERAEARILVRSGEWVQVAVACPPQFSTSERLRVRMLSAGRELASYTIAPTPAGNSYHTRVAAGDAEFQVDVRVGEFSASARCRVNDLPRIDDRPTLKLQLEGVR